MIYKYTIFYLDTIYLIGVTLYEIRIIPFSAIALFTSILINTFVEEGVIILEIHC